MSESPGRLVQHSAIFVAHRVLIEQSRCDDAPIFDGDFLECKVSQLALHDIGGGSIGRRGAGEAGSQRQADEVPGLGFGFELVLERE